MSTPKPKPESDPNALWAEYKNLVYGRNINLSAIQEKECREAFFAGMYAFWGVMKTFSNLSESDAVEALDGFTKSIKVAALSQNPTGSN